MLTLQNSVISRALWLPRVWYYGVYSVLQIWHPTFLCECDVCVLRVLQCQGIFLDIISQDPSVSKSVTAIVVGSPCSSHVRLMLDASANYTRTEHHTFIILQFSFIKVKKTSIDPSKLMGNIPEVLNVNCIYNSGWFSLFIGMWHTHWTSIILLSYFSFPLLI
jgi:hypothetical protein